MRLIHSVFFIFCTVLVYTQSRPDEIRVTYSCEGQSLKGALNELSALSGVSFAYSDTRVKGRDSISIDVKNETLGQVLSVILKPFNLTFRQIGDQLVIIDNDNIHKGEKLRIYGFIKDETSGEPLMGVNVFTHDKSHGTNTNSRGFYSFLTDRKPLRIHFTYVGYASRILDIDFKVETNLDINLIPDGQLNEIVINEMVDNPGRDHPASYQNLPMEVVRATNHLAGEPDLMRYISMLHGVSTASEGVGGLSVRGGTNDQNLILLDGIPLYNSGHALGIFSVFNGNAIKSSSIYRAGMPARYHGRLSSVLDIHTKDGNNKKYAADFTLSTIAANGTIEGPILKDRASFIVSYRRTILDVWINEFNQYLNTSNNRTGLSNYFFDDFSAKIKYELKNGTDIQLHGFHTRDRFETNRLNLTGLQDISRRAISQANRLYSFKLNHRMSHSLFTHFTAYSTQYDFNSFRNRGFQNTVSADTLSFFKGYVFDSYLVENGVKVDNDWMVLNNHYIKFGASLIGRKFNPRTSVFDGEGVDVSTIDVSSFQARNSASQKSFSNGEANIYIEDEFELIDGLTLNAGVNVSTFIQDRKLSQGVIQPRLSLISGGDMTSFKAGITRMAQYVHQLNNNGLGFPTDIWMPSSEGLPVQKSWIFNMDFGVNLPNGYKIGLETYYKVFNSISDQREGAFLDVSGKSTWEASTSIGKGQAYGIDTYVEKSFGKTMFNINYSFAISDRIFTTINNGNVFPFDLNRRHSLKTSATYRISEFSEFLFNWSYMSGTPFSRPQDQVIVVNGRPQVVFPSKNNALFPDFHRLDLGFSFYNVYKWGRVKFFVGVYNAYNRLNPFFAELVPTKSDNHKFEFRQLSLLPLLPTISYSISL